MAGRPKKQEGVTPELRREWLELSEEKGLAATEIGKRFNNYAPRTVRKHLELARQERERKETRLIVLRDATQEHYRELIHLLERVQAEIGQGNSVSSVMSDRRWKALIEHMPKLALWRHLEAWEEGQNQISGKVAFIMVQVARDLRGPSGLSDAIEDLDIHSVASAFAKQARTWRTRSRGPDIAKDLKITPGQPGKADVRVRAYHFGQCKTEDVDAVKKVLLAYREKLQQSNEVAVIRNASDSLDLLAPELDEELATIILRKVLPGHCRYCPV